MITSPMTGNLGNNMWCYVITRAVAEHNGYDFGFNRHPDYDYHKGMPQLDFMDIDYGKEHNYSYHDNMPFINNVWNEKFETIIYPDGDRVDWHEYQPEVFDLPDSTKLVIRCCQDARYLLPIKDKVREWFRIKENNLKEYKNFIGLNEDGCILNVRGGEYKGIGSLILQKKYYDDAMQIMLNRNPNMKFACVTDDVQYARELFEDKIKVIHHSIGGDYYIVNHAHNLILSNSSFAILPAWLNENNPYVIAPWGWARHNMNHWANSHVETFGWDFMDREGVIREA